MSTSCADLLCAVPPPAPPLYAAHPPATPASSQLKKLSCLELRRHILTAAPHWVEPAVQVVPLFAIMRLIMGQKNTGKLLVVKVTASYNVSSLHKLEQPITAIRKQGGFCRLACSQRLPGATAWCTEPSDTHSLRHPCNRKQGTECNWRCVCPARAWAHCVFQLCVRLGKYEMSSLALGCLQSSSAQ